MNDGELIAEQIRHTMDLVKAENEALKAQLQHDKEVYQLRLSNLEKWSVDAEERLRTVQDSAVQFKVLAGLATGGGLLSLIALIRALLGN